LTSTLPSLARATSDDDLLSTTDLDGEGGSLDDLSSKDSHKDADSCHRMNRETSRDPSVDSALSSADGGGGTSSTTTTTGGGGSQLQRFSTNSGSTTSYTTGDDENVAVKYSPRDQFNDFISSRQRKPQRNVVTCTISATNSSMRNGSEGGSERRGSDLQRQKPIVMRSISGGGYEAPKSCSTVGLQRAATTMSTMDTSGSGNNNNNEEDARKAKSPGHDDEPIMV
jgi:hypothetical protein